MKIRDFVTVMPFLEVRSCHSRKFEINTVIYLPYTHVRDRKNTVPYWELVAAILLEISRKV